MNKKIVILFVTIILIFVGVGVYFIFFRTTKVTDPPTNYILSINTTTQDLINGTVTVSGVAEKLTAAQVRGFATISFNTTHDTLWVLCPTGYNLSNPSSTTQSKVDSDPGVGAYMEIDSTKENNITITCSK